MLPGAGTKVRAPDFSQFPLALTCTQVEQVLSSGLLGKGKCGGDGSVEEECSSIGEGEVSGQAWLGMTRVVRFESAQQEWGEWEGVRRAKEIGLGQSGEGRSALPQASVFPQMPIVGCWPVLFCCVF